MLTDITLTKKTHDRLVDIALPLECADSVVSRLIDYFSVKTTAQKEIAFQLPPTVFPLKREPLKLSTAGEADPPVRPIGRKVNSDVLRKYLRRQYVGVAYHLACYDLLSRYTTPKSVQWIVLKLFRFPNDDKLLDRIQRATHSLKISLREYRQADGGVKLFAEPKAWNFTINLESATPAPESGNK